MKGKQFKIRINTFYSRNIISAILLALIPAFTIILIEPINFQKYKIELSQKYVNPNRIDVYRDADKDGNSELYRLYDFADDKLALMIYDKFMNNIYQYNSKYFMPFKYGYPSVYFADINNDDSEEIIYLSQYKDSLFLNIFSYKGFEPLVKDRFITKIGINKKRDYYYKWIIAEDVNDDKYKELFFSVNGKFSLFPRKIFRYDYINNSLISSENTGSRQRVFPFYDKEGDLLLFSSSNATNNCDPDFPYKYQDTSAWIFGYDKDLKFLFEPVSFCSEYATLSDVLKSGNEYFVDVRIKKADKIENKIIFFNETGEITDKIKMKKNISRQICPLLINGKEHFFVFKDVIGKFVYSEFNPVSRKIFKSSYSKQLENLYVFRKPVDIDEDAKPEFIFSDRTDNNFYLYRNNLKHRVKIPFNNNIEGLYSISSKMENDKISIIFTSKEYIYYCTYYKNPDYNWKYPFWLIVFIISFIFVRIIQVQQKKKFLKQDELKNKIVNLQLKNTQNQLDPHFTFNALNVVASKIYKEDRNTAYDLFERFSRLMRSSLAFSDKIFRPLSDELQFTEDYLEFQKTRFKDLFEFKITVSDKINTETIEVPKMILQGFAENCVKHAFKGVEYKGEISITITHPVSGLNPDRLNLIIEDNGIGIKRSNIDNPKPESGYGIITTQKQIELINKLYNKDITIEIIDKSKNNTKLNGTLIIIVL